MEQLSTILSQNLEWLQFHFGGSADFYAKELLIGGIKCAVVMFDGITSGEKLSLVFLSRMEQMGQRACGTDLLQKVMKESTLPTEPNPVSDYSMLVQKLSGGFAALLIEGCSEAVLFSVQSMEHRSIGEPSGEGNVRGSQESFTDHLRTNMALLRRTIRSDSFVIETGNSGEMTCTEYALCYDRRVVPGKLLSEIKERLKNVQMPILFDSAYLAAFLHPKGEQAFQPVGFTERTVTAAAKICEGKLLILVNGSPFALIYPYFFAENFESLDDYAFSARYAGFTRIIKYLGFFCAILLPALYVMSIGFTPEIIPVSVLKTVLETTSKTPLPPLEEALVVMLGLEIIRIADLQMPKASSHSVSLVAALIIGGTAVEAGFLGTALVTCVAISSVALYMIPNLYEQIVLLRFLFLFLCGIFGLSGLAIGLMGMMVLFSRAGSNYSYLMPLSPIGKYTWRDGFLRQPWNKLGKHRFGIRQIERKE